MKKNEFAVGIILFIFGVATIILSLRMEIGSIRSIGTGFFPLLLGILLMILSLVYILKLFIIYKKSQIKIESNAKKNMNNKIKPAGFFNNIPEGSRNTLFSFIIMILAAFFINILGYLLTSFLLMTAFLRLLGIKKLYLLLIISVITASSSYLLFVKILKIALPKGFIGI
jgi:putative tricarboxylic transport membrane protein